MNSDAISDSISTDSDAISTKPSAYLLGAETRPLNTILICHVMSFVMPLGRNMFMGKVAKGEDKFWIRNSAVRHEQ